jgi:hypothetical protein
MEISPFREATSCALAQEFHKTVRNVKVHYHVSKNPSLISTLSQMNLVHTNPISLNYTIVYFGCHSYSLIIYSCFN